MAGGVALPEGRSLVRIEAPDREYSDPLVRSRIGHVLPRKEDNVAEFVGNLVSSPVNTWWRPVGPAKR